MVVVVVGGGRREEGGGLYNNIEAQVSQTLWRKWRTQYPYILSNIIAYLYSLDNGLDITG